jgi:hypothetical protein
MQITVTPQEEVRHRDPVNRTKYRGWSWESGKGNPQPTKDEDQKGSPGAVMGTPQPCTGSKGGNYWHKKYKANDWRRDNGRNPKNTHFQTDKKE